MDAIRKTPASYHEDSCIISWGLMVRFISGKRISKRSPTCPHDIFITPHDMSGKNLHVKNIPPEMVQKTFFSIVMFRAHFTEKMSWVLVGRFAATVFNEMLVHRADAKLISDPTTLMGRTTVLWAVLQCHRVMQEFIQLRFNGHTAIVREMSFFMLMDRVSSEDVAEVKRKLEESEKHGAATTKRLKQTEDRLDKVEAKCAELKSDIAALANTFKQFKNNDGKGTKAPR